METVIMIVIDLKLDNFKEFRNFHLNMSYPKKVVHSTIVDECLKGRTNFRYKKLNILMGGYQKIKLKTKRQTYRIIIGR